MRSRLTSLILAALVAATAGCGGSSEEPAPPATFGGTCAQLNDQAIDPETDGPLSCLMDTDGSAALECELQAGGPIDFDDASVDDETRRKYVGAYAACFEEAGKPMVWQEPLDFD